MVAMPQYVIKYIAHNCPCIRDIGNYVYLRGCGCFLLGSLYGMFRLLNLWDCLKYTSVGKAVQCLFKLGNSGALFLDMSICEQLDLERSYYMCLVYVGRRLAWSEFKLASCSLTT